MRATCATDVGAAYFKNEKGDAMTQKADDDDYYTAPDGRQEAAWMRPHRDLIAHLAISDADKQRLNDALDSVYDTAIHHRAEDHISERRLLRTLLRAVQPPEPQ